VQSARTPRLARVHASRGLCARPAQPLSPLRPPRAASAPAQRRKFASVEVIEHEPTLTQGASGPYRHRHAPIGTQGASGPYRLSHAPIGPRSRSLSLSFDKEFRRFEPF